MFEHSVGAGTIVVIALSISACFDPGSDAVAGDTTGQSGSTGEVIGTSGAPPLPDETSTGGPAASESTGSDPGASSSGASSSGPSVADETSGDGSTTSSGGDDGIGSSSGGTTGGEIVGDSTGEVGTTGEPLDPVAVATVADLGLVIPDDAYDGTIGSMACAALEIDDPRDVDALGLVIGMTHTFVGDLVIKVVPPRGPIVTVMMRPGVVEPFDGNIPAMGNGSGTDLLPGAPVQFSAVETLVRAEDMGATLPGVGTVCLDDGICEYRADAGVNAPAGDITALAGVAAAGTWSVCFGDATASDVGAVDFVTLSLQMQ